MNRNSSCAEQLDWGETGASVLEDEPAYRVRTGEWVTVTDFAWAEILMPTTEAEPTWVSPERRAPTEDSTLYIAGDALIAWEEDEEAVRRTRREMLARDRRESRFVRE
jgi:hypothetical protein